MKKIGHKRIQLIRVFQPYTLKGGIRRERYFGHVRTEQEANKLIEKVGLRGLAWGVQFVSAIQLETGQIITHDDIAGTRKHRTPYLPPKK